MLLVHIGHCLGDPRAVRAQHRVDLVLRDELLVEAGRCLPIRCVIIDHELNPTPEHSAFLIRMLLAKKVTFTNVAPLYGGLSGESRGAPMRIGCCARPADGAHKPKPRQRPTSQRFSMQSIVETFLTTLKSETEFACAIRQHM